MSTRALDINHRNAQEGLDGLINEIKELISDRRERFGEKLDQAKIWADVFAGLMPSPPEEGDSVEQAVAGFHNKLMALTGLLAVAAMRGAQPDAFAELGDLDFEPSLDLDAYFEEATDE